METQVYRMDFWTQCGKESGTKEESRVDLYALPYEKEIAGEKLHITQGTNPDTLW